MKKLNARLTYYIFQGAWSFFFALIVTVNLVYQVTTVGLNPLQLVLVGTALEISAAVFEIPTGIVADVYGRRLSVIIGTALTGLGFVIEGSFPVWGMVMLGQAVWGFGWTFISGALDAWIADEIGVEEAAPVYLRAAQIGQVMGLIGILPSVLLASISISLPIVLGGVMFVGLGGFLLLFMPEEGFTPTPPEERDSWRQMRDTLRQGVALVRVRPVLVGLLLIGVVYGAYSEGFDRLWTAFLLNEITLPQIGALQPVMWFGIIRAVTMLLGIGGTELARRRVNLTDRRSVTRALTLFYGTMALGTVVFALSGNLAVALAAFWLVATARTVAGPIFTAWFNQHVDSRVRATMLSMSAQADEIGQIAGGPVIGAIGTVFSLRIALALGGLILLPVLRLLHGQRIQVAPVVDSTPAD